MKDRDKLIIAIIAVLLIIGIVGGATFAYWSWASNTTQQTNVSFTVSQSALEGQLYANLDGGGETTFSNLAPVSSCTDSTYAMKKTLTLKYKNATANPANIYATLTLSDFEIKHGSLQGNELSHIRYAVTDSPSSCDAPISGMSGTFTATSGALFSEKNLLGTSIPANTTTEQTKTLYLYVWIDDAYEHTNYGDDIDDPLQNMSFNLTWSGNITNE